VSKSKSTKKKAAQGKAKPAARVKSKPAAKKKVAKPVEKKKTKSATTKKAQLLKKSPLARGSASKKPAQKSVASKPAAPKKPASKAPAEKPVTTAKPQISKQKPATKTASKPQASAKTDALPAKDTTTTTAAAATSTVAVLAPTVSSTKKTSTPLPAAGPTKSGALFYDSHMHTPLCKHAWGEPEEYAQQALKAGLKGIIFTCHCPMPDGFWPTVRMSEGEFDTYLSLVQRAADAFKGKLDIRLGIESEYFPGYEDYISKLHQRAEFHYVLGAVHWQAKEYLNKFETGTIENFRRTYFDHLAKSAESGLYDCLAHPDLVKNYHPDSWCFAIVKNSVATALDRIAATGVAMELNTSGLNKSYSEMNPGNEMLRMMAERKIPVVLGSDSHRAARVGEHFVTALNNLTESGYEKVSYFLNRQRIDLKISDVLASLKKAADHNA